jgi:hypothetical protein
MPGLDPGIHSVSLQQDEASMEWIAGSSPAMTRKAPPAGGVVFGAALRGRQLASVVKAVKFG